MQDREDSMLDLWSKYVFYYRSLGCDDWDARKEAGKTMKLLYNW